MFVCSHLILEFVFFLLLNLEKKFVPCFNHILQFVVYNYKIIKVYSSVCSFIIVKEGNCNKSYVHRT